jgi:hypothetical protein
MMSARLCRSLLLLVFELDLSTNSRLTAQSIAYFRRNSCVTELERVVPKIYNFRQNMLKDPIAKHSLSLNLCKQIAPMAAQDPKPRPWFWCMCLLRGGADRSFKRLPQKRKRVAKADEDPMGQTMRDLEERKERWKEQCDPSDVDDLSSERGDSDQPDIYKPPLEIEEGDVRD